VLLRISLTKRLVITVVVGALAATGCTAADVEEPQSWTEDEMKCVHTKATQLASVASKMNGSTSKGLCYRYVKAHLRAAGFPTADLESKGYGASAYAFTSWAKAYPSSLASMGLQKVDVALDDLPKGAILVWPRGMCGYSQRHGHIEVVVDDASSRACSDFCGRIKKGCGTPDVYVPKGCSSKAPSEDDDASDDPPAPAEDGDDTRPMPRPAPPEDGTDDDGNRAGS